MKRILVILLILTMVLGCVACKSNTGGKDSTSPPVTSSTPGNDDPNNGKDNESDKDKKPTNDRITSSNVEVLDSKINYIVINNKKIYLTKNFKDFTLQFKGLGCLVKGENQSEKEIDTIDENDPTLIESARTNDITCYNSDERNYVDIRMHTYTEDQGDINEIYWWHFSSTRGLFDLHINNKTLFFGTEDRIPSTASDLINVMGNKYEEEPGSFSDTIYYNYIEGRLEYKFRIDKDDESLKAFNLSISPPFKP